MKKILPLIRRIVLGFFILYGYNVIAVNFDLTIPINLITVGLVSFLGFPALFSLVLLFVIAF